MMYEVETFTVCDGWVNRWHDDGELIYFDTPEQAQLCLDSFLEDLDQEIASENIEPGYTSDEYRVAPVQNEAGPSPKAA